MRRYRELRKTKAKAKANNCKLNWWIVLRKDLADWMWFNLFAYFLLLGMNINARADNKCLPYFKTFWSDLMNHLCRCEYIELMKYYLFAFEIQHPLYGTEFPHALMCEGKKIWVICYWNYSSKHKQNANKICMWN